MKSIVNYTERGHWGKGSYRGNCSGYMHKDIIKQYHCKFLAELFAGSGTGAEAAEGENIQYVGADLNANFVHEKIIRGYNAITDEVPDSFRGADFLFMHPPYGKEINIPYAGYQWDKKSFVQKRGYDPAEFDLGQMPWEKFMSELNKIVMKFYAAMENGSRMGILMGDVKRNGICHSMIRDIVQPGVLENIIIKAQNNCLSDNRAYSNLNFVPIVHEYLMVIKKCMPYQLDFSMVKKHRLDIRDSKSATWKDIIASVIQKIGHAANLSEIYREVDGFKKTENNPHWREKIRQVLQTERIFQNVGRGVWALALQ